MSIDILMLCTHSPAYFLPLLAYILQNRLGLAIKSGALDNNLGCFGCIHGMALTKRLIASEIANKVLLLTSKTNYKYLHPTDRSNLSIICDTTAACLMSTERFAEIAEFSLGTYGIGADMLIVKKGSYRHNMDRGLSTIDSRGHICHDDYLYRD